MEEEITSLLSIIAKYETTTEDLYSQLDFYYIEQEKLRSTTKALLQENEVLAQTVENLLQIQEKRNEETYINSENELIKNLRSQLLLINQEKESAIKLWQNSLKAVDELEDSLRIYQTCAHDYVPKEVVEKIKEEYEMKTEDLKKSLQACRDAGVEYRSKEPFVTEYFNNENAKLQTALSVEMKKLNDKIVKLSVEKKELEKKLLLKNKIVKQLRISDTKSKEKVNEALYLIDVAFLEKDAALQREMEAKDKMDHLAQLLADVNAETPEKIKNEIQLVKNNYSDKLKSANEQIEKLKQDLSLKQIQIDKLQAESDCLKNDLHKFTKLSSEENQITKLLMLEKNLESTFQQLLLSEKKTFQFAAERDTAKTDLEDVREHFKLDIRARDAEKHALNQKIEILQRNLHTANSNHNNIQRELETTKTQMENMSRLYNNNMRKQIEKLQRKLHLTFEQLETQVKLNNKWRREMKNITEKFQTEFHQIQHDKKLLKNKLKELEGENVSCKKSLKDICSAACVDEN